VVRVEGQTLKDIATSDGRIDTDRIRDALRPYVKGEDHKTEVLLDARQVTWEHVVQIQDGARAAGVQTVHHLLRK
jgi:biopolymer transport protein ExbD